jgi:hypothetical protein
MQLAVSAQIHRDSIWRKAGFAFITTQVRHNSKPAEKLTLQVHPNQACVEVSPKVCPGLHAAKKCRFPTTADEP